MGALKILAERVGVEITKENPKAKTEKERMYKAIEYAAFFYHKELSGSQTARAYLTKRGVTVESMKQWRLGYAPSEWRALYTYLIAKGFTGDELVTAGLVKKSDNGYYDVFRSRIVFPISDTSGRIIAFSGRIFPEEKDVAKYLNTSETFLFNKSATLYGYDRAKIAIRDAHTAILVEGQMDLLLSHQLGIIHTVATSGTAFTEFHAQAIKRFAQTLIICFDGDNAGVAAALRAATVALGQGLEVKVAFLPDGKDPADLAIENKVLYEDCLKNAVHVVEFALKNIFNRTTDVRERGQLVVAEVLPFIKSMTSSVEQAHFVRLVASRAMIREEALWEELKKTTRAYEIAQQPVAAHTHTPTRGIESQLFGIVYLLETMKSPPVESTALEKRLVEIVGQEAYSTLKATFEPQRQELLLQAEISYDTPTRIAYDIDEFCYRFEEEVIKKSYTRAMQELADAEVAKDQEKVKQLLEYCKELSHRLSLIHKHKK